MLVIRFMISEMVVNKRNKFSQNFRSYENAIFANFFPPCWKNESSFSISEVCLSTDRSRANACQHLTTRSDCVVSRRVVEEKSWFCGYCFLGAIRVSVERVVAPLRRYHHGRQPRRGLLERSASKQNQHRQLRCRIHEAGWTRDFDYGHRGT